MPGAHEAPGGLFQQAWLRRSVRTFLQAFLGLMIPGFLGWLNALTEWAKAEGQAPFPDGRSLAYLGVSAIGAGCIAVVTALMVKAEDVVGHGILRDVPAPDLDEKGTVSTRTIAVAALVLVVLVVLL